MTISYIKIQVIWVDFMRLDQQTGNVAENSKNVWNLLLWTISNVRQFLFILHRLDKFTFHKCWKSWLNSLCCSLHNRSQPVVAFIATKSSCCFLYVYLSEHQHLPSLSMNVTLNQFEFIICREINTPRWRYRIGHLLPSQMEGISVA